MSGEPKFLDRAAVSRCRENVDLSLAGAAGVRMGYCPQQDALDEFLTGWEHLRYYCTLRGVPNSCISQVSLPEVFQESLPLS